MPVDAAEFCNLLAVSEPRSGSPLWLGGFLVVLEAEADAPDFYRISYYGGFFRHVGTQGWYELPEAYRARWERLLGGKPGGALHAIIDQRGKRNRSNHSPPSVQ